MGRIGRIVGGVLGVLGLLVAWTALVAVAPARAEGELFAIGDDPLGAAQLLASANAERAAAGLPALAARDDVYGVAVGHSRRMADAYDIFHNDGYFTASVRSALSAKSLGENVAMNKSIDDAHRRLMNSPGHRANLMDPRFTVVGIAVVRAPDGMAFVTQDFVEPNGSALPVAPVAAPVPAPAPPKPAPAPAPAPAAPAPKPAVAPTTTASPATTTTTAAPPAPVAPAPEPAPATEVVTAPAHVTAAAPMAMDGGSGELAAGRLQRPAADTTRGLGTGVLVGAVLAIAALVTVAFAASRAARRAEDSALLR